MKYWIALLISLMAACAVPANPELTPTQPSPTHTAGPPTATHTATSIPPSATPSPTAWTLTYTECNSGPGFNYDYISALSADTPVYILAISDTPGWVAIAHPKIANLHCWVQVERLRYDIEIEALDLPVWKSGLIATSAPHVPHCTPSPEPIGYGQRPAADVCVTTTPEPNS